jgi:hypothetical protein
MSCLSVSSVTITVSGNYVNCDFLIMLIFFFLASCLFLSVSKLRVLSETPSLSSLAPYFTPTQRKRDFQYFVIRTGATIRAATVFLGNAIKKEVPVIYVNMTYNFI